MKLTADRIRGLLFGAYECPQEQGVLTPKKCSERVRTLWHSVNPGLGRRAEAPTGIRLDFHTDASEVTFTLSGGPFDCLIDGLLADRFEATEGERFSVTLDGRMRRVTLVFPSHFEGGLGRISALELDSETVLPHEYGEKFLFLGDSITQGWNSQIDTLSFAWRCSLHCNADCRIVGVGGAFFLPEAFETQPDWTPDRVFIAFGTNDFRHFCTLDELKTAAEGYLDRVVAAYGDRTLYGITPIWRTDTWVAKMGTFDECIDLLRSLYEARGIRVIDGLSLVPNRREFFADAVHPNALGFSMYAENLLRAIED